MQGNAVPVNVNMFSAQLSNMCLGVDSELSSI